MAACSRCGPSPRPSRGGGLWARCCPRAATLDAISPARNSSLNALQAKDKSKVVRISAFYQKRGIPMAHGLRGLLGSALVVLRAFPAPPLG